MRHSRVSFARHSRTPPVSVGSWAHTVVLPYMCIDEPGVPDDRIPGRQPSAGLPTAGLRATTPAVRSAALKPVGLGAAPSYGPGDAPRRSGPRPGRDPPGETGGRLE